MMNQGLDGCIGSFFEHNVGLIEEKKVWIIVKKGQSQREWQKPDSSLRNFGK